MIHYHKELFKTIFRIFGLKNFQIPHGLANHRSASRIEHSFIIIMYSWQCQLNAQVDAIGKQDVDVKFAATGLLNP